MAITSYRITATATLILIVACHTHTTSAKAAPSPPSPSGRAPAPAISDCFRALVNTSDCLTYVKAGSNLTAPDKGCCPEVGGLVERNPICLCELLSNPKANGNKIDVHRALKLPSLCGIPNTPTVSTCSAAGVPVSLAPISDSISPSDEPIEASAPTPSEEATSTSIGSIDNASSSIKSSALLFMFGFAIAFCLHILLISNICLFFCDCLF